jgi:putative ABC transport system permease protein
MRMKNFSLAFGLALAYVRQKKLSTALNVLLLSLGVATIIALLLILHQAENRMNRDAESIDLVIGAKGSPMQLILSSVFHVDIPTGNINMGDAATIIAEPAVKRAIPLALGDSYRGFRIVGTNPAYIELYDGKFAAGKIWDQPLQAVLGADVAKQAGLTLGSKFTGSHGLTDTGGHAHEAHPYVVVGILAPTGSVVDRLILASVASVWQVHGHGAAEGAEDTHDQNHDHDHDHTKAAEKEVTAYLIQYSSPLAAVSFPRMVNASSSMQAAAPAMEAARLFQLIGIGVNALKGFALIMMLCAALGIFIGLMNALDERRADLALLRVLGASRSVVITVTILQGLMLGVLGVILGVMLGHAGAEWIGQSYGESQRVVIGGRLWIAEEWSVIGATLALALLASLVPAWRAYRDATPELLAAR